MQELQDEQGNFTGEYAPEYSEPVRALMNVSAAKGAADIEMFGMDTPYTHLLVTEDMTTAFDTESIFWIGSSPTTGAAHNFRVLRVARSLNHVTLALGEVDVS